MTSSDAFVLLFLYSYQSQCDKFIDVNFPEFTNAFFNNLDLRDGYLKDLVAPQASNFFLHQTNLNQTRSKHHYTQSPSLLIHKSTLPFHQYHTFCQNLFASPPPQDRLHWLEGEKPSCLILSTVRLQYHSNLSLDCLWPTQKSCIRWFQEFAPDWIARSTWPSCSLRPLNRLLSKISRRTNRLLSLL